MGNYSSSFNINYETLKESRLIDNENLIYIGIVSQKPYTNPYSSQAIKIGELGKIKRLEKFIETNNNLIFEYESNTSMILSKRDNNIIINIKELETNKSIIKPMDLIIREIFKPIYCSNLSCEYDKIHEFVKPEFEDIQSYIENKLPLESNCVISHQPMER